MHRGRFSTAVYGPSASARAAVLAATLLGCAGAEAAVEPPKAPLVICYQPLVVSAKVLAIGGPLFSWAPACGATYLEVTSPNHQQVFWIVQGDTGRMAPGVTYAVAPGGYESRFGPNTLELGRSYTIRVGVMVDENSFYVFGEHTFVR